MFTLRSFATIAMDTIVSTSAESERPVDKMDAALERAIAWFGVVERACSRFYAQSELVRWCRQPGTPLACSAYLFEALGFASMPRFRGVSADVIRAVCCFEDGHVPSDPTVSAAVVRDG
jgi:hypothetical protein